MREVVADFQLCGDSRVFGEFLPVVGSQRVQQVPVRHERRVGQLGRVLCPQRLQDAELGHPVVRREKVAPDGGLFRIVPVPASVVVQLPRQGAGSDPELSRDILLEEPGIQESLDLVS